MKELKIQRVKGTVVSIKITNWKKHSSTLHTKWHSMVSHFLFVMSQLLSLRVEGINALLRAQYARITYSQHLWKPRASDFAS